MEKTQYERLLEEQNARKDLERKFNKHIDNNAAVTTLNNKKFAEIEEKLKRDSESIVEILKVQSKILETEEKTHEIVNAHAKHFATIFKSQVSISEKIDSLKNKLDELKKSHSDLNDYTINLNLKIESLTNKLDNLEIKQSNVDELSSKYNELHTEFKKEYDLFVSSFGDVCKEFFEGDNKLSNEIGELRNYMNTIHNETNKIKSEFTLELRQLVTKIENEKEVMIEEKKPSLWKRFCVWWSTS